MGKGNGVGSFRFEVIAQQKVGKGGLRFAFFCW
jgi:hypothetical protein